MSGFLVLKTSIIRNGMADYLTPMVTNIQAHHMLSQNQLAIPFKHIKNSHYHSLHPPTWPPFPPATLQIMRTCVYAWVYLHVYMHGCTLACIYLLACVCHHVRVLTCVVIDGALRVQRSCT